MATRARDPLTKTGPALEAMYRFILWLVPTVEKMPRSQKFTLGDRIETTALDVLDRLLDASYTKARQRALQAANVGLDRLRILFRLASDLRILDLRRYEHAARTIDEIGRLIGSWRKQSDAAAT